MPRMPQRATSSTVTLMAAGLLLAGCASDPAPSPTLTGAAARSAQDQSSRVRELLAPQPAGVGETPRRWGPVSLVAPAAMTEADAGPAAPRKGWTYKRLTDPKGNPQTSLGLIVAPTAETTAEQSAGTIARTGGSRDAGSASGIVTTTTWEGRPAHLAYVNTSTGLHVEALSTETPAGTITVIAQAPVSSYPTSGLRRALRSVDLTP